MNAVHRTSHDYLLDVDNNSVCRISSISLVRRPLQSVLQACTALDCIAADCAYRYPTCWAHGYPPYSFHHGQPQHCRRRTAYPDYFANPWVRAIAPSATDILQLWLPPVRLLVRHCRPQRARHRRRRREHGRRSKLHRQQWRVHLRQRELCAGLYPHARGCTPPRCQDYHLQCRRLWVSSADWCSRHG